MKVFIKKYIFDPIWDTFFPRICFLCDSILSEDRKIVCSVCLKNLPKFKKTNLNSFDNLRISHLYILFDYDNRIRTLVHLYKYKRYLTLANYFAIEAVNSFPELKTNLYNAIIPVPLHKIKYRERGYNQSAILADHISQLINVPVKNNLLIRKRYSRSQTNLNKNQREINVLEAFSCNYIFLAERVLLIDDIITTGSTVNACAEVLLNAGIRMVDVFALANPKISVRSLL